LSGHLQGRLLSMISHMVRPAVILEIGTFTGYSAICLAEGLVPEGKLITLDVNEELEGRVRGYFDEAGLTSRIDYRIGKALLLLPAIDETFDLVFIDADKENYIAYFERIFSSVRPNGFILADNVLFHGEVLEKEIRGKSAKAIQAFNDFLLKRTDVEKMLLPLRDGLMLIRKL